MQQGLANDLASNQSWIEIGVGDWYHVSVLISGICYGLIQIKYHSTKDQALAAYSQGHVWPWHCSVDSPPVEYPADRGLGLQL